MLFLISIENPMLAALWSAVISVKVLAKPMIFQKQLNNKHFSELGADAKRLKRKA